MMSTRSKIMAAIELIAKEQRISLPRLADDLSLNETGLELLSICDTFRAARGRSWY